jgi:hypothetical protein
MSTAGAPNSEFDFAVWFCQVETFQVLAGTMSTANPFRHQEESDCFCVRAWDGVLDNANFFARRRDLRNVYLGTLP